MSDHMLQSSPVKNFRSQQTTIYSSTAEFPATDDEQRTEVGDFFDSKTVLHELPCHWKQVIENNSNYTNV